MDRGRLNCLGDCDYLEEIPMSENMVSVPHERINRFANEYGLTFSVAQDQYTAVARDLAQHPIVPTDDQLQIFRKQWDSEGWVRTQENRGDFFRWCLLEWQRRMFLAEPEIPEEVKDLIFAEGVMYGAKGLNGRLAEAFRRGQHSKGSV
jgi:hypothetical protein